MAKRGGHLHVGDTGAGVSGLLDGRVAIVTGGGGGIGRGVVERFVAEGASVVFAEIDATRAQEAQVAIGARSVAVVCDVRDDGAAPALVTAATDAFGRVDILVNNVGHYGGVRKAFHEQTDEEWDELYRVNLGHVFALSRAVLPTMIDRGDGGAIVNVSTIEAFRAIPTRAVYSAFKAAITGFTRSLAVEYAQHHIRVNAIAPDVTETLQVPYSRWVGPDEQHLIPAWVPLGRFGRPADVAAVALFLASELSAFVTGTTVHVDGGTFAAGGWFPTEEGGWTNRPRRP
jgi:NAD(P)-dependent dehydrogenase (short-subunit alcohol dehydrogenase family)